MLLINSLNLKLVQNLWKGYWKGYIRLIFMVTLTIDSISAIYRLKSVGLKTDQNSVEVLFLESINKLRSMLSKVGQL
jgi:nucleoside recognition membrane protein YjiH